MLDESDSPQDFVTSGIGEEGRLVKVEPTPEGPVLYNYLSGLLEPLGVSDYSDYVSSLGLSNSLLFPVNSFLTAPVRHGGAAVGSVYLANQVPGKDRPGDSSGHLPGGRGRFQCEYRGALSFNREARRVAGGLPESGQEPEELLRVLTVRRTGD